MRRLILGVMLLGALVGLSGCSKFTEPFHDAPRGSTNSGPADVGTMPDGMKPLVSSAPAYARPRVNITSASASGRLTMAGSR